jgi:hypothetical protein
MRVLAPTFQHDLGLKEEVAQHMFDLQQAQQDHDCAETFDQIGALLRHTVYGQTNAITLCV